MKKWWVSGRRMHVWLDGGMVGGISHPSDLSPEGAKMQGLAPLIASPHLPAPL